MSVNMANIKWVWVTVGVTVAMLVAYGATTCVVTTYSAYLSVQAQGPPDVAQINAFAASNATAFSAIFAGLGTFLGGLLAARKATLDLPQNALAVGVITAFAMLIPSFFTGTVVWGVLGAALALGGGWLAGRMATRPASVV